MQQDVAQQRSRDEDLDLKNKRTGLTIFQISWIMAFISLIVVNWQLRFQYRTWPPPEAQVMDPVLPTIATVGLLISTFFARRALHAIKAGRLQRFLLGWRVAIGLGIAFIAVMAFEWINASVATQYGVLFRLMTAFHGFHAFVIGAIMIIVHRKGQRGNYGAENFWAVEGAAKLWYFVTVAWILFYIVLYWI